MKKIILLSSLSLIMISMTTSSFAKIYKWKDSKGVTHYSATPPLQKGKAKKSLKDIEEKIRFAAGKHRPSAVPAQTADSEAKKTEIGQPKDKVKLSAPGKKLANYCKQQRGNLSKLKKNFRNNWIDTDGKSKILDQKERQEKADGIAKTIKDNCEGV